MSTRFPYRGGRRLIPVLLCCCALASATPSGSGAELALEPHSAEQIALLEELADWVGYGLEDDDGRELQEVVRKRRASFDVFRRFHGAQLRTAQLDGVPWAASISRAADRQGLDPLLVAAVVEVESRFDPGALSHRGAVGLMQVLPMTAGVTEIEPLLDPERNLGAGTRYLRRLLDRYRGDLVLALAAYNAGPANVRRYDGVPPFRETRGYVEKVLRLYVEHHRRIWRESSTADRLASFEREAA